MLRPIFCCLSKIIHQLNTVFTNCSKNFFLIRLIFFPENWVTISRGRADDLGGPLHAKCRKYLQDHDKIYYRDFNKRFRQREYEAHYVRGLGHSAVYLVHQVLVVSLTCVYVWYTGFAFNVKRIYILLAWIINLNTNGLLWQKCLEELPVSNKVKSTDCEPEYTNEYNVKYLARLYVNREMQ